MRRFLLIAITALIVLPLLALADNDDSKKPALAISAEGETAALAFVQQHHNDLFELLIHLKEGMPQEYERAIRDLSRASDRLAQLEKRDLDRYRIELQLWQAESRRQLLTARLQMGYDESLLKELREVLKEEQKLELAVLRHERERLAGRIAKIEEQIAMQENSAEASVERKFSALTKAAKNSERNVSNKNRKPATRKNTKDPT